MSLEARRRVGMLRIGVHLDEAIAHVRGAIMEAGYTSQPHAELDRLERELVVAHNLYDFGVGPYREEQAA